MADLSAITIPITAKDETGPGIASAKTKLQGFQGLELCSAQRGDLVELLVISRWQSMDAVKAFAGPKPEKAVIEPGAKAVLEEFDDVVFHYEVALEAPGV